MARRYRVVVNLGAIMRERGLKAVEVEKLCGVDRTHVSKIASHQRLPRLDNLARLCIGLNVPVAEMVSFVPVDDEARVTTRSA